MTTHPTCPQACTIPDTVTEVPPPRHDWGDVLRCPNDGCGRAFLIKPDTEGADQQ